MKNGFLVSLTGVLCFILGYLAYPQVNSIEEDNSQLVQSSYTQQSKSHVEENPQISPQKTDIRLTRQQYTDDKQVRLDEISSFKNDGTNKEQITNEASLSSSLDDTQTFEDYDQLLEDELKEWSSNHKTTVQDLITTHMSPEAAESMFGMIAKDNEFLTKPTFQQSSETDQVWAFEMEQQLQYLIEQHELSPQFELLNISCKQLMCDIVGIEKQARSWLTIYFSLLSSIATIDTSNENGTKSIQYVQDENYITYWQIKFKSH